MSRESADLEIADQLGVSAPTRDTTNPKDLIGQKKAPLWLIPGAALIAVSWVMGLGAKKYGPYNWRGKAVRLTVYIAAAQRHLLSCLDGEWTDPESGQPHLAHAAACACIVLDAYFTGNLIDDRPPPGVSAKLIADTMIQDAPPPAPPPLAPSITPEHFGLQTRKLYASCPTCGSLCEIIDGPYGQGLCVHPCLPVTTPTPGRFDPVVVPNDTDRLASLTLREPEGAATRSVDRCHPNYPDCSGRDEDRPPSVYGDPESRWSGGN